MGKDNALGNDPLSWMKLTKENKKSLFPEDTNTADQNTIKNNQQISSSRTVKQQIPLPTNDNKPVDIQKGPRSYGKVNSTANSNTPRPKVVIGSFYEKPSAGKAKPLQHNENVTREIKPYLDPLSSGSRYVQPIKRLESEINRVSVSTFTEHFSTYVIIAYTALMLILGSFVYNDLSKRTNKIEARIFAIEKALHPKQK
ncbi:MAG TPA: hypothetical protein ACFYEC_04740 [Candidatus Brocadiaceae bacterium]